LGYRGKVTPFSGPPVPGGFRGNFPVKNGFKKGPETAPGEKTGGNRFFPVPPPKTPGTPPPPGTPPGGYPGGVKPVLPRKPGGLNPPGLKPV